MARSDQMQLSSWLLCWPLPLSQCSWTLVARIARLMPRSGREKRVSSLSPPSLHQPKSLGTASKVRNWGLTLGGQEACHF